MTYTGFIVAFMIVVVAWDIRFRRIPNAITVTGLAAGVLFHTFSHTLPSALLGAMAGFLVGFLLFYLAAIGAGDLKLLIALGALLGFNLWLSAMVATVITAGVMALIQAIMKRRLLATFRNMGMLIAHMARFGLTAHPELNVRNKALIRSPFGVAAGVGVLLTVLR